MWPQGFVPLLGTIGYGATVPHDDDDDDDDDDFILSLEENTIA